MLHCNNQFIIKMFAKLSMLYCTCNINDLIITKKIISVVDQEGTLACIKLIISCWVFFIFITPLGFDKFCGFP